MENNKLSTGLTVWLWIIFVLNILATIGAIISAILMPVITYLFAKNDIANGTIA